MFGYSTKVQQIFHSFPEALTLNKDTTKVDFSLSAYPKDSSVGKAGNKTLNN